MSEQVSRSAGGFLGGLFNNPGLVALGALAIGLFLFRDKISEFFQGAFDDFGKIELPSITLPEIKFPEFPSFPEFPDFFPPQQQPLNPPAPIFTPAPPLPGGGDPGFQLAPPPLTINPDPNIPIELGGGGAGGFRIDVSAFESRGDAFNLAADFFGGILKVPQNILMAINQFFAGELIPEAGGDVIAGDPRSLAEAISRGQIQGTFLTGDPRSTVIVPVADEFGLGGGPSFIGGQTTFGSDIVDTLSEVLNLFPGLTASQAADALAEFPGLTASEFRLIDPDVINITQAPGDPLQIFLNASGDFSGLTPEQISLILTKGGVN